MQKSVQETIEKGTEKQTKQMPIATKVKIKMTEVLGRGNTLNGVTQQPRSVDISIANIFAVVNAVQR